MKRTLAIALLLGGLSTGAGAQPSPAVSYLMNTPVTLFGAGMERLEARVHELTKDLERQIGTKAAVRREGLMVIFGKVAYDAERDRIEIRVRAIFPASYAERNIDQAREDCKSILNYFRYHAGVNSETGGFTVVEMYRRQRKAPPDSATHSYFADLFAPRGFARDDAPRDYLKRLDEVFEVHVRSYATACHGPLVSNQVFYSP